MESSVLNRGVAVLLVLAACGCAGDPITPGAAGGGAGPDAGADGAAAGDPGGPPEDPGGELGTAEDGEAPDGVGATDSAAGEDTDPSLFAYLVVEPDPLDFGTWPVGDVQTRALELENAGSVALTLTDVTLVGGSGAFGTNATQLLLPPGETRVVMVTFYVLGEGVFEDVLRFESNAVNGAVRDVALRGAGLAPVCEDLDGDGYGPGCALGPDCNESDPDVHPGAPERCNGLDEDCDGLHDEDFVGLGGPCGAGFGQCTAAGFKVCASDQTSLRCSVNPVTGGSELCNDLDDDCDGATDEDFPSKGKLCFVGLGACAAYDKYVCTVDGTALVCNVSPGTPTAEICGDGIDNDCDGKTDEGELEICGDGVDNDCDGETDESGSTWGELFFARNHYSETVAITPANGDGTFEEAIPLTFPDGNRYSVVAVGDFDGDKYLDLVVLRTVVQGKTICTKVEDCPAANVCSGGVCRKTCTTDAQCDAGIGEKCIDTSNNSYPDDTFCLPPREILLARSGCGGDDIALTPLFTLDPGDGLGPVIDADGNGHLDFVGLNHWSEKTTFTVLNDGNLGFQLVDPSADISPMFTYSYFLAKTSKDLDGDGLVDMVGVSFTSGGSPPTTVYQIRGNGDGTFQPPVSIGVQVPYPANLVTANDFDGDGDQDIVAGLDDDGQPGGVWLLLNRGQADGKGWVPAYEIFDVVPAYNSGGEHPGVGSGTSFDFDGDHLPDVLAAWTPEECGSYVWECPAISAPTHPCYGGYCRKVAYIRNRTGSACPAGTLCVDGACTPGCVPDCSGKACGGDGCSGSCGTCQGGQICAKGACVVDCVPDCGSADAPIQCGDNGCGGTCGTCAPAESCLKGQCVAGCTPSCTGKQCGDDGCGGRCAVFAPPEVLTFDDNPATNVNAPTNVPPTRPTVAIQPPSPTPEDDLTCALVIPSYDLDAVTYRIRWFRDGVFVAALGEAATVPAALTAPGDTWSCEVRATDGVEWSPTANASALVTAP